MNERLDGYVGSLSKMINIRTVSLKNGVLNKTFDEFHSLLKILFPNVFKTFKYEEFNGSILLSLIIDGTEPVLFMSHHDVVSENGEWVHKPFSAIVENGKLYGRGTLDTKGNLWAILTSIEELIVEGYIFKRSIYIESSCNEETSGEGAFEISRELIRRGVHFLFTLDEGGMIVKSPISHVEGEFAMIALGEKDYMDIKFIAKSNGGHSSTPDKNNPLSRLSKLVSYIDSDKLFKAHLSDTTIETFRRISNGSKGMLKFVFKHAKGLKLLFTKVLSKLSPVTESMVKSTLCFTKAEGSDDYNVIPTLAYVCANIRVQHSDDKNEIIKKLECIAKRYDIEVEVIDEGYSSNVSNFDTKEFKLLDDTIKESFEGVVSVPYISVGASDSKYFNELSENIFRFAPFSVTNEQLDTMHAKDENIDIDSLPKAVDFYKNLIRKL